MTLNLQMYLTPQEGGYKQKESIKWILFNDKKNVPFSFTAKILSNSHTTLFRMSVTKNPLHIHLRVQDKREVFKPSTCTDFMLKVTILINKNHNFDTIKVFFQYITDEIMS